MVARVRSITKAAPDADGVVQSLNRALKLLELLAEDDDGYRLTDLAERAGLSASTTHRLLTTLEQKRFVQFDRDANLWHVGVQCFTVGASFARRRNFATLAFPVMRRLRDSTGETVNLGLADQGDVVFLGQVESRELMRAMGKPGGRMPLACTAMGQAILAAMTDQEVSDYVRQYGLPRRTPSSIARPTGLHEALAEARRAGYAVDHEENAVGLRCVAAVIHDEYGRPFAAVSIAGPTVRVTLAKLPELSGQVLAAAQEITTAIGGHARSTAR
jgi:IclR family transcriptional regulator, acetate operon repressor